MAVEHGATSLDLDNLVTTEQLEAMLAGLMVVSTPRGGVELVHHTAHEYFERSFRQWSPHPHLDIAHTCVTFLTFDVRRLRLRNRSWLRSFWRLDVPLLSYAATYWGFHAGKIACQGASEDLQKYDTTALRFLSSPRSVRLAYDEGVTKEEPNDSLTAAHLVALVGTRRHMKLLIEQGFDVDRTLKHLFRPLHLAVKYGNEGVCEALVASGKGTVDAPGGPFKSTPLHLAVETHRLKLTALLLATRRVNINAQDTCGRSPIHIALTSTVPKEQYEYWNRAYRKLPSSSASHSEEDCYDVLALVKTLLGSEAIDKSQVDFQGRTALHLAAAQGRADCISALLERGFDVNTQDTKMLTPLDILFTPRWGRPMEATKFLHSAQALHRHGAVRNYGGRSILLNAALLGDPFEVGLMLLDNYSIDLARNAVDVMHLKRFVLELDSQNDEIPEIVTRLVVKVTVEELQQDYTAGGTLLTDLLNERLPDSLEEALLADQRFDPNLRDKEGTSLLTLVATTGPLTLLQKMTALGGDLCAQNDDGFTPLSWAIIGRQVEIVRYLLGLPECGITLKDSQGNTSLDLAIQLRDSEAKRSDTESEQTSQSPEEEILDMVKSHPYFRPCDETVEIVKQTSGLTLKDGSSDD